MGVVDRKKSDHRNGNDLLGNISADGFAARTRPFSFEEIMLRRKNKKLVADTKDGASDPRELSEKNDIGSTSKHSVPDDIHKPKRNLKDATEAGSRKKEEIVSNKEDRLKHKHKAKPESEGSIKAEPSSRQSGIEKQSRKDTRSHMKSKADDKLKPHFEKESGKKRSKDATSKDMDVEMDRKPPRENKRMHYSGSDSKTRLEVDRSSLKKRDSHRVQDEDYPERGQSWRYDEPKPKRRRSRSQEYNHGRERSASISPRARKGSYRGRDHEEQSFHSVKGRSVRQYSDLDKHRTSRTGAYESGYYRHRGSGLGGYSPRKRRAETAVKSPSPTIHSPDKKVATWDLPPSGSLPGNVQSSTTSTYEFPSSIPVTSTTKKSQPESLPSFTATALNTSVDSVQLAQATRPMRRLYIENLPASASDKSVIEWLNGIVQSSGVGHIQKTPPFISCIVNKEKSQAVVEFLTPEDATTALSFSGRSFSGSILKIRRPKDFVDTTTGIPDKPLAVVESDNKVYDVVKNSPHKIFIGGISKYLLSGMLMDIVTAFGPLRAYHFEMNEELNEPCAFLEYADQSITLKACAGLNGMKLGGRVLTVVKALSDCHQDEENAEVHASYKIPEHARSLLRSPTLVLKLKNVFKLVEFSLLSEPELEETLEDIRLECARFGTVKSINIVRHSANFDTNAGTSEQYANDKKEIETEEGLSGMGKQLSGDTVLPNEAQDVEKVTENQDLNNEETIEDHVKKESCNPSLTDFSTTFEKPPQLDNTESCANDSDVKIKVDEELIVDNNLVPEELKPEDMKTESKEHSAEPNITNTEHSDSNKEDCSTQNRDGNIFEPGCVLVEFLRKEATCMAAHCLNGRLYGDRVVAAGYIAHDAYLERFPR